MVKRPEQTLVLEVILMKMKLQLCVILPRLVSAAFVLETWTHGPKRRKQVGLSGRQMQWDDVTINEIGIQDDKTRRKAITGVATGIFSTLLAPISLAWAADAPFLQADSAELASGLLESRVTENLLSPPSYGMEVPDIFYPTWFKGVWRISSKTTDVQAPCGIALFGGNATFDRAKSEIGTTLNYESRFIPDNSGRVVADREYNVKSIAKAAMGEYSVLDIAATPNKVSVFLAPNGSPQMLKVDLLALNRRQEVLSDLKFDCSEVTREIVAPASDSRNSRAAPMSTFKNAPVLKEVETTSLYTYNPAIDEIQCLQRSATFLTPSQSSPMAFKMWEASIGRPIDVRFYDVKYRKVY